MKNSVNGYEIINLTRKSESTLIDVLETQAQNLHDMMLLFVASHCYLKKNYEDSVAILTFLDQSLSSVVAPDKSPRQQIRKLAMNSCLQPTQFLLRDIPRPDKLSEIRQFAETALSFFDDSYFVPVALGRIRFLDGDVQGAVELTERFKEKIDLLKETGRKPTPRALVLYCLNAGFLSFIQGHWMTAYKSYQGMLSINECHDENWEGIIEFIDYVETLEFYEGISYLQTFYRLIAKKTVQPELQITAKEWVDQDDSRKELNSLLSRKHLAQVKLTNRKIIASNTSNVNSKQRSKRKRKPRKKR